MLPKSMNKGEFERGKKLEKRIWVVNDKKTWRRKVVDSIQKPYVGEARSQSEAREEIAESRAIDYSLVIVNNDSGEGFKTLQEIRNIDPDIPVIYTSMMPDDPNWLARSDVERFNAHLHHTKDTASEKANELIAKYINEEGRE